MNGKITFIYWLAGLLLAAVGAFWGLQNQTNAEAHARFQTRVEILESSSIKSSRNIALICQALDVKGCQP